jgi:hypothetical protein
MNVVVVGLGRAAWLYATQGHSKYITHTYSILNNPNFNLVAGIDTNKSVRDKWTNSIGINSYAFIEDLPSNIRVDLIIICTSKENLLKVLLLTLKSYPGVKILVEKPLVTTLEDIVKIEQIESSDIDRIAVNFPRLFLPENNVIKSLLARDLADSELEITGNYSKGFLNTATHLIMLINNWFPGIEFKVSEYSETFNSDLGLSFNLMSETTTLSSTSRIAYNSVRSYSTFDLNINSSTSWLKYINGGETISFQNSLYNSHFSIRSSRKDYQKYIYEKIGNEEWDFIVSLSGLGTFIPIIKKIITQNVRLEK